MSNQNDDLIAHHNDPRDAPLVFLYGPPFGAHLKPGSLKVVGGYVRNMEAYIQGLNLSGVRMRPLFHTFRGEHAGVRGSFAFRMLEDCVRVVRALVRQRPAIVHVIASYRAALPREIFMAFLCRLLHIPLIYDIKAGAFAASYEGRSAIYKWGVAYVVKRSVALLVEGKADEAFLQKRFNKPSQYFPNFVPESEAPVSVPVRLTTGALKVLFVGHCYEGKGVFELVEGCRLAALKGHSIELTLIGDEAEEFARYCDGLQALENYTIKRLGRKSHEEVRQAMFENDIFCFPSRHKGEGHSNAINEAMMTGMIIVCTKHGFLQQVVEDSGGYLLVDGTKEEVALALMRIAERPQNARAKAAFARQKFLREFTGAIAKTRLEAVYGSILDQSTSPIL